MSELLQTASSAGQTIPLVPIVHVGQIVHFVLPDGPEAVHGHCRPAIVVAANVGPNGKANLVAFYQPGDQPEALIMAPGPEPHTGSHGHGKSPLRSKQRFRTALHMSLAAGI